MAVVGARRQGNWFSSCKQVAQAHLGNRSGDFML